MLSLVCVFVKVEQQPHVRKLLQPCAKGYEKPEVMKMSVQWTGRLARNQTHHAAYSHLDGYCTYQRLPRLVLCLNLENRAAMRREKPLPRRAIPFFEARLDATDRLIANAYQASADP